MNELTIEEFNALSPDTYVLYDIRSTEEINHGAIRGAIASSAEELEENQWKVCGEIVDRVVKIAIRLLKNSYSQCMKENIVTLLEYLRFELDTINENQ